MVGGGSLRLLRRKLRREERGADREREHETLDETNDTNVETPVHHDLREMSTNCEPVIDRTRWKGRVLGARWGRGMSRQRAGRRAWPISWR